jgi:PII-like signaling protein
VSEDWLKLTTYFGERDRANGELVADALLDVYGRHAVQVSVLLRGAQGFGIKHHLRTDRQLTLSEDLPVVSVAVDARERIEAMLGDVMAIKRRGLVTLERARMLTGEASAAATLPEAPPSEAAKLTVYVGRQDRVGRRPAFVAVCDLLHRRGIAGATVLLGVDGTAHGVRERARFLGGNANVPMMIVAVGSGDRIAGVLPELRVLLRRPLLTLERVHVCKRDGELLARPAPAPSAEPAHPGSWEISPTSTLSGSPPTARAPSAGPARPGKPAAWQKLTVFGSERSRHGGEPVHVALIRALRQSGAAGATTVRGVWGFHGDHAPHGDRLLQVRRHVPVVTTIIDTPGRIARSFEVVDALTRDRGLVTSEPVPDSIKPEALPAAPSA